MVSKLKVKVKTSLVMYNINLGYVFIYVESSTTRLLHIPGTFLEDGDTTNNSRHTHYPQRRATSASNNRLNKGVVHRD